jgi:hypothetical protein
VIDAAIPGLITLVSAIWLSVTVLKHYRKHNAVYEPLIKSTSASSYGALDSSSQTSEEIDEEEDDGESEDTLVSNLENQQAITIFDASRFLAMLMAGLSIYNLVLVINGRYAVDERVESDNLALFVQYIVSTMVWVRITENLFLPRLHHLCLLTRYVTDNRLMRLYWHL